MTSNSEIVKARIAELRRKRAAAKGVSERATYSAQLLRRKANQAWADYVQLGQEIEALGGKVRR